LKKNILEFLNELISNDFKDISIDKLREILIYHKFTTDDIVSLYSVDLKNNKHSF